MRWKLSDLARRPIPPLRERLYPQVPFTSQHRELVESLIDGSPGAEPEDDLPARLRLSPYCATCEEVIPSQEVGRSETLVLVGAIYKLIPHIASTTKQ